MASPSKIADLLRDIGRAAGGLSDAPPSMPNMITARRSIPTGAFDPETGAIDARGLRFLKNGVGEYGFSDAAMLAADVLDGYRKGDMYGAMRGGAIAYPKGKLDTKRHETFHALVRRAALRPEVQMSPGIDALGAIHRLSNPKGFSGGAADLLEELAATSIGRKQRLPFSEVTSIARSYAPSYRADYGLMHSMPAYLVGYGPDAALGGAAIGSVVGGAGYAMDAAQPSVAEEPDYTPEEYDKLIARLGK